MENIKFVVEMTPEVYADFITATSTIYKKTDLTDEQKVAFAGEKVKDYIVSVIKMYDNHKSMIMKQAITIAQLNA